MFWFISFLFITHCRSDDSVDVFQRLSALENQLSVVQLKNQRYEKDIVNLTRRIEYLERQRLSFGRHDQYKRLTAGTLKLLLLIAAFDTT